MNRIDRLTGTLLMLQSQRKLSVGSIASHWEISERTVYRDIAALSEAGVPIVFEPEFGYRLMGGYEVPPVIFSEDEALALFLSGEIAEQVADNSLKKSLRSALLKIRSVLPDERRDLLENFKKSLGIWLRSRQSTVKTDCLIPIHSAVLQHKCMRIFYDTGGRGEVRERVVEPQGILFYGNHWHLVAFCQFRKDYRDFRMDRMKAWEIMDVCFTRHADFSLDAFVSERDHAENLIEVTVVVNASVAKSFESYLHFDPLEITDLQDGYVRFTLLTPSIEYCAHWFLGYGDGLRVEHPAELKDLLKEMAASIVKQYS